MMKWVGGDEVRSFFCNAVLVSKGQMGDRIFSTED